MKLGKAECEEVMTEDVKKVFHIDAVIGKDPRTNKPMCITYNLLKGEIQNEKTFIPLCCLVNY